MLSTRNYISYFFNFIHSLRCTVLVINLMQTEQTMSSYSKARNGSFSVCPRNAFKKIVFDKWVAKLKHYATINWTSYCYYCV